MYNETPIRIFKPIYTKTDPMVLDSWQAHSIQVRSTKNAGIPFPKIFTAMQATLSYRSTRHNRFQFRKWGRLFAGSIIFSIAQTGGTRGKDGELPKTYMACNGMYPIKIKPFRNPKGKS